MQSERAFLCHVSRYFQITFHDLSERHGLKSAVQLEKEIAQQL